MVIPLLVGAATLAKERPVSNGFKQGNGLVYYLNVWERGKDSFWKKGRLFFLIQSWTPAIFSQRESIQQFVEKSRMIT